MATSSSKRSDDDTRALAAAIRYTRVGVRSIQELREYLSRRGFRKAQVARVIEECKERGFVDDLACARLWAGNWARRGYAWVAIREKLSEKDLDKNAIVLLGRTLGSASEELARARQIAKQKARNRSCLRDRARLGRSLAARGFNRDVIDQVVSESFGPDLTHADD